VSDYSELVEALDEERQKVEFLKNQQMDILMALQEKEALLKVWMRAEPIVYEITPAGRCALAEHRRAHEC
jgi:uncharacterized protein (UPF0128 family)